MSALKQFLAEQAEKARAEDLDLAKIRDEWIGSHERLIAQMRHWLAEADPGNLLRVEAAMIRCREHGIGEYDVTGLWINFGSSQVRVVPVARFVAGPHSLNGLVAIKRAFGRVDLTNGAGRYMIVRVEKEPEDRWSIIEQESYRLEPFDRGAFERAMQSLLE